MAENNAPYKNTRSSAGNGKETQKIGYAENLDEEVFENFLLETEQENCKSNRNRTPSGHLLTTSVGDIRNFFASGGSAEGSPFRFERQSVQLTGGNSLE